MSRIIRIFANRILQLNKDYFGITYDAREAGYITPEGEMLDFSGKQFGGDGRSRSLDHREVLLDDENKERVEWGDRIIEFIKQTNCIRIGLYGGIGGDLNLDIYPYNHITQKQIQRILKIVSQYRIEYLIIDLNNANGYSIDSIQIEMPRIRDVMEAFQKIKEMGYSVEIN